jgi:ComF family protein
MIHSVKFDAWHRLARQLGEALGERIAERLEERGIARERVVLCPIPIPRMRRVQRGIDHAGLVAVAAGRSAGIRRRRLLKARTGSRRQTGRTKAQRTRGLEGGMRASRAQLRGCDVVVLVDDVMTTGATLNACARSLKRSGAQRVDGVCLARVVKPLPAT